MDTAPFVVVGPDATQGHIEDPEHPREIGGPWRWWNFFIIASGVSNYASKDACSDAINRLCDRAFRVLRDHRDLDGLTAGSGKDLCNGTDGIVDQLRAWVYGGESEWHGQFRIEFHLASVEG